MTPLKMNEKLSKYTKEELEAKVKELSSQGMKKTEIYKKFGVSEETFRRHMAILKDPEGYAKKQEESRATRGKAEANKGIKALNGKEDNFWQNPEDALEKFKKDFKERKRQIMLKEARDPYYSLIIK